MLDHLIAFQTILLILVLISPWPLLTILALLLIALVFFLTILFLMRQSMGLVDEVCKIRGFQVFMCLSVWLLALLFLLILLLVVLLELRLLHKSFCKDSFSCLSVSI